MRVAALYDIHANLPALEGVLKEVRDAGAEHIIVGGDVVPGPMPRETIERLMTLDLPISCIHGNGERVVLSEIAGVDTGEVPPEHRDIIRWTAEQVAPSYRELLTTWPLTLNLPIQGLGDVLFCHATPRNDTELFTRLTDEDRLRPVFEGVNASLVVCGHTHMQFDRRVGSIRVVNAGSVGMPFGGPGAYWLLLGPDVELRRTTYDLAEAAARIRRTSYPQAEEFAARYVLDPPSEEQTLAAYRKYELK